MEFISLLEIHKPWFILRPNSFAKGKVYAKRLQSTPYNLTLVIPFFLIESKSLWMVSLALQPPFAEYGEYTIPLGASNLSDGIEELRELVEDCELVVCWLDVVGTEEELELWLEISDGVLV